MASQLPFHQRLLNYLSPARAARAAPEPASAREAANANQSVDSVREGRVRKVKKVKRVKVMKKVPKKDLKRPAPGHPQAATPATPTARNPAEGAVAIPKTKDSCATATPTTAPKSAKRKRGGDEAYVPDDNGNGNDDDDDNDDEVNSATGIGATPAAAAPKPAKRKRGDDEAYVPDDNEDENEENTAAKIGANEESMVGTIIAPPHATVNDPQHLGWTQAEVDLLNRLNDRGAAAILPAQWQIDFPTMPDSLFMESGPDIYIKPLHGTLFRAYKAFDSLLMTGLRARDKLRTRSNAAPIIKHHIQKYIDWSLKDGRLLSRDFVPNIALIVCGPGEPVKAAVERAMTCLKRLASDYRQALISNRFVPSSPASAAVTRRMRVETAQPAYSGPATIDEAADVRPELLPTLYSIVITNGVMAFLTLDAANPGRRVNSIGIFDWRRSGQDVWNTFAIAIMVVQARNYLVCLDTRERERSPTPAPDPDA